MKRLSTLTKACRPIGLLRGSRRALSTISYNTKVTGSYKPAWTISSPSLTTPQSSRQYSTESAPLSKTALYDFHVESGAKMVPFSGFHMPVQYSSLSVSESHHFTRASCSLFDVSHMVQHEFSGPGAEAFLEKITPAGIKELGMGQCTLSALLKPETGGIVDDTIIARMGKESFYVVTNAGCREKDLEYLKREIEGVGNVKWDVMNDYGLIALQGPKAEAILTSLVSEPDLNVKEMYFGTCKTASLWIEPTKQSSPVKITRGGYTGEDGFEISVHNDELRVVTEAVMKAGGARIALAGLGARDSLRLEAGMCLYGHDLDETVTPVEASLSWIIGKDRKVNGGFHGDSVILSQLTPKSRGGAGVSRRRIGLLVEGAPAREGAEIFDKEGVKVGVVTSGCPSPSLKKNIAMGYIKDGLHKAGTEVDVVVRGKKRAGVITKMPFVPTKYWKGLVPA